MQTNVNWGGWIVTVLILAVCILSGLWFYQRNRIWGQHYIAHAGGMIDGYTYTNSKEAVLNSIKHGITYIELDLQLTKDSILVATHDWNWFNKQTGREEGFVPTLREFKASRIYGKYTPLTCQDIDSIFNVHKDLMLVTDKISDPKILDKFLHRLKSRMLVECFSEEDYNGCKKIGIAFPMISNYVMRIKESFRYDFYTMDFSVYNTITERAKLLDPASIAVFKVETVVTKQWADSLFATNSGIKLIYIDKVE